MKTLLYLRLLVIILLPISSLQIIENHQQDKCIVIQNLSFSTHKTEERQANLYSKTDFWKIDDEY